MKTRNISRALLSLALVLSACNLTGNEIPNLPDEFVPTGGSGPIRLPENLLPRAAEDQGFALNIFRTMAVNTKDTNIVISPLSISLAFGMVWNGANGTTKEEIGAVLGLSAMPDSLVNQYYGIMQKSLPVVDSATTVNIANSLWYDIKFALKPSFLQTNQHYFDAEVHKLDFLLPTAKDTINQWVDEKTNHLIPKIVEETKNNCLFLINAVYFKGAWALPFSPKETYESNFTRQNGSITKVNMMSMLDTVRYASDAMGQYVDLAYGNGAYNMMLLLPAEGKTTDDLLQTLTPASLNTLLGQMVKQKVQIALPRFKTECSFNLIPVLKTLGIRQAFTDMANFSELSAQSTAISEVKHKTFVEVTEKGTTAAAVTSIGMYTTSLPDYPYFTVNKPFLFLIRETGTGVVLFAGKLGSVEKY